MDYNQMKNMIVIKSIPSNVIEEAIVILKSNKKIKIPKELENKANSTHHSKEKNNNYILKEAESVICNYLSKIEKQKKIKSYEINKLEKKYKKLKIITSILGAFFFLNIVFFLSLWYKF